MDILIVGGGPSGLLIGSLLGKHLDVTLIERGRIQNLPAQKYWITNTRRLALHKLESAVRFKTDKCSFGTFLGDPVDVKGDFVVVNKKLLIRELADRCRRAGVTIYEETPLESIEWRSGSIRCYSTHKMFRPRLLVDASGAQSTIAQTFKLHRLFGFYSICSLRLENFEHGLEKILGGHVFYLGNPPVIIEVVPLGQSSLTVAAFTITRRLTTNDLAERTLQKFLSTHRLVEQAAYATTSRSLSAAIPIGSFQRGPTPYIASFGEAGLIQAPFLGGAFNEALETADGFAGEILDALRTGDQRNLKFEPSKHKKVNDYVQRVIVRKLINAPVSTLENMTECLHRMGNELRYRFLDSDVSFKDVPKLAQAAKPLLANSSSNYLRKRLSWSEK